MSTEEKILLAAMGEFEIHGFAAATTKAIAAQAGVAEVTLFRIFGDKRTLFDRVLGYISEKFGLREIPGRKTEDLRADILALCHATLRNFIQYNALFRMLIFEAKHHEDIRDMLMGIRGRALENVDKLIGGRAQPGGARQQDWLEWLASSLMGASLCYCLFHGGEDREAYIHTHAGLIADAFLQNEYRIAGKQNDGN